MEPKQKVEPSLGLTGNVEKDGLLTQEQYKLLNEIQIEAAAACIDYLNTRQEGQRFPLVAMATGFGKGKIIHELIKNQIDLKPDSKILVIAGTKLNLVDQTKKSLDQYQIIDQNELRYQEMEDLDEALSENDDNIEETITDQEQFSSYSVGRSGEQNKQVHVTTIQNVQSKYKRGQLNHHEYDLVIIDEVHNVGTKKRVEAIQGFQRAVGFTATPYRTYGKMKEPGQYGFEIIRSLPLPETQELGFLPPLFGLQINTSDLVEEIPANKNGKIDYTKMEKILKNHPELRPYIVDKIIPIITAEGKHYKTVIAVNYVWEAQEIAQLLKIKGIKVGLAINKQAARIHHTDEIPTLDSIERYHLPESDDRSLQVIISPYLLGEGFDAPFTEMLVWASPTDSPLRYTQYTGRLARRWQGKAYGVVIDCLYQISKYGWSYNMAMWMKGFVQQLEDGTLYLGPIKNIENLASLKFIQSITDTRSLQNKMQELIQKTRLFPIPRSELCRTYNLDDYMLGKIVGRMKRKYGKHFISPRKYTLTEATEKGMELLIQEIELETQRGEILPLQDNEIALSQHGVGDLFKGDKSRNVKFARNVACRLVEDNPALIVKRRDTNILVDVVTDRNLLIKALIEEGLELKKLHLDDYEWIRPTEFSISMGNLFKTFHGNKVRLYTKAQLIIRGLAREDPSLIVQRRNERHVITAVTDSKKFIKRMLELGERLK